MDHAVCLPHTHYDRLIFYCAEPRRASRKVCATHGRSGRCRVKHMLALRAGIMELADLVVVNKADGDLASAARRAKGEVGRALQLVRCVALWPLPVHSPDLSICTGHTQARRPHCLLSFYTRHHRVRSPRHEHWVPKALRCSALEMRHVMSVEP